MFVELILYLRSVRGRRALRLHQRCWGWWRASARHYVESPKLSASLRSLRWMNGISEEASWIISVLSAGARDRELKRISAAYLHRCRGRASYKIDHLLSLSLTTLLHLNFSFLLPAAPSGIAWSLKQGRDGREARFLHPRFRIYFYFSQRDFAKNFEIFSFIAKMKKMWQDSLECDKLKIKRWGERDRKRERCKTICSRILL